MFYVSIAGDIASGKTTLCRNLSERLEWSWGPQDGSHLELVSDLFANPNRWVLEAQLGFLRRKTQVILTNIARSAPFLIDRSIEEDIHIFPEVFSETAVFSARAYGIYRFYSDLVLQSLPSAAMMIYCQCSTDVRRERIRLRGRPYENSYPAGHLDRIAARYEEWISAYGGELRVVDTTEPVSNEILMELAAEIRSHHKKTTPL